MTLGPSEDAQEHRTATTGAIFTFLVILHSACHMLTCTEAFIGSTVAAASATHLQSSQVSTRVHSNNALACQFKVLLATDRIGSAAEKGHFRILDFAGYFVFALQRAYSFHRAEG